jgi:predicted MPP superfamily phosphohydrolase
MSLRLIIFLSILLVLDLYAFQSIRFLCKALPASQVRAIYISYLVVSLFCFGIIVAGNIVDWHTWNKSFRMYSFAIVIIVFLSKIFIDVFLLFDDVVRVLQWIVLKTARLFNRTEAINETGKLIISRSGFIVKLGLFIAAVPFFSLIYGMINGAYNYRKRKVTLTLNNLPASFDGFKIVQISDIHSGSFTHTGPLEEAVRMINELDADVVFFTGDLVNDKHEEALPYLETLRKIKSRHGVFSIFGNHDYGDYVKWESPEAKKENVRKLADVHKQLGWDLLLDEHRYLEQNGERISIIGVQNWSARLGFQRYGSLEKAVKGIHYAPVNILLSHDPSHWHTEVTKKYKEIDLTLSGHTHGFQFGVEIPGFKWSPVQYIYKEWADLYQDKNQFLYVNRGLGFLVYPGRVGILPEITLIELKKA